MSQQDSSDLRGRISVGTQERIDKHVDDVAPSLTADLGIDKRLRILLDELERLKRNNRSDRSGDDQL